MVPSLALRIMGLSKVISTPIGVLSSYRYSSP